MGLPDAIARGARIAAYGTALLLCVTSGWAADAKDPQNAKAKDANLNAAPALGAAGSESAKAEKSGKYDLDRIGARGVGSGLNLYSLEGERALGASMAAMIDRHTKFYPDPEVYDYINGLAQKIARHSDAQVPLTVRVIDSPDLNIFSLPGGYLYVNKGLITELDSEAELAALMAHEIAHVAARHGTRLASRKRAWSMVSLPLNYLAGPAAAATQVVPLTFRKFSRDAEIEADLLGLEYQNAAGYDPQAFLDALEKWNSKEKQKQARMAKALPKLAWLNKIPLHRQIADSLSNYPHIEDRILKVQNEVSTALPTRDDYVTDTSEFEDVKAKLLWADRPILRRHRGGSEISDAPVLRRPSAERVGQDASDGKQLQALSY
jgi:Zn-dependent protease with chaperone function